MEKKRGFFAILIPSATVFMSSACIMVLELVASRLIARHLGSSLYTWTAVIGVVLAGITIGNWIGGRLADKFKPRKALSVIFLLCSISCVITIILNNVVGNWLFLWTFSWPLRVFSHVSLVFLFPSVLLGTISPVVAKMALDQGLPQGRTVGDIYAWSAAGSIAGTFLAGYFLIAVMGTIAIIWAVAAALLVMSLLYWLKLVPAYLWSIVFITALLMGMAPYQWAEKSGSRLKLRLKPDSNLIYEDNTQYCYVAVKRESVNPEKRAFFQDKLKHSAVNMEDISDLQYFYTKIYSAFTHELSKKKDKLSVMIIGGGGYVYPRYIEQEWPGSRVDVVEIDPGVTKAAIEGFGLSPNTIINSINMDARNFVDDLLEKKRQGQSITAYDFIYEDAINDYSVPFQLVTKEFNDKIAQVLADDGVYMVNLIDIFDSGLFLGAVMNTLKKTFPYVNVVALDMPSHIRNTFVLAASKHPIDTENIMLNYPEKINSWILTNSQTETLEQKNNQLILTDNFAPVENLLAPVVKNSAKEILADKYMNIAEKAKGQKKYEKSISYYHKAIKANPNLSIKTYNEIAIIQANLGNLTEAVEYFNKTIQYNNKSATKNDIGSIYYSLGITYLRLNKQDEANKSLILAIEGFKEEIKNNPNSHLSWSRLGNAYATIGNFNDAANAFKKAFSLRPSNKQYFDDLLKIMEIQEKYDGMIDILKTQVDVMKRHNAPQQAIKNLQDRLDFVEFKKAKSQTKNN